MKDHDKKKDIEVPPPEHGNGNSHSAPVRTAPPGELTCEECGATSSRRGVKFLNAGDLLRHQANAHRRPGTEVKAPGHAPAAGPKNGQRPPRPATHEAKFCPNCGLNLEVINAALGLIHGA